MDEATRKSLFKLRSTWDEIFPLKKLYALDVRVNSVDPAWPIKPLPPNVNASIHVNPKFLKPVSILRSSNYILLLFSRGEKKCTAMIHLKCVLFSLHRLKRPLRSLLHHDLQLQA